MYLYVSETKKLRYIVTVIRLKSDLTLKRVNLRYIVTLTLKRVNLRYIVTVIRLKSDLINT